MSLTTADIIEAIVDELGGGELGERFDSIRIERTGPGSLFLEYGGAWRFRLDVTEASV